MKKSIRITVLSLLMLAMVVLPISAGQRRTVTGSGSRGYNGSLLVTGWTGQLRANSVFLGNDSLYFTGKSYSKWHGGNPYNADSITHYDILEVNGIGSVSFSASGGVSASGPSGSFGISATSASNSYTYAYSQRNAWQINVYYSYYSSIWDWSYMDLFTSATFKFGSTYIVVNSRINSPYINRGPIYYY